MPETADWTARKSMTFAYGCQLHVVFSEDDDVFCRITVGSRQATVESFVGEIAETFSSFYCCVRYLKWIIFQPVSREELSFDILR